MEDNDDVINERLRFRALATKFAHEKNLKTRRKLLELYGKHLINFKRTILTNRRRWQQRLQRRQARLRSFFMQHLLELETSFLEILPTPKNVNLEAIEERPILPPENTEPCDAAAGDINRFYENEMGLLCNEDWLSELRMQKSNFEWLSHQLNGALPPVGNSSILRKQFYNEKQIALGVFVFATGFNYEEIARKFQIFSRISINKFAKGFAEAIIKKFAKEYLSMPTEEKEYDEIANEFYKASNMPALVVGMLGVCELTAKPLLKQSVIPQNETERPTIIMQTLIDNNILFRKVKIDSNHPTLFLEETNEITNLPPKCVNGHTVSRFIVTPDTYYPLRKWLMHKYEEPVEPHEFDFNEAVDHLFVFRDRALQRLFGRWRILSCYGDLDSRALEKIAIACCILHNILEKKGEVYNEEWTKLLDTTQFTLSTHFKLVLNVLQGRSYSRQEGSAVEVREFLGRTISSTEM